MIDRAGLWRKISGSINYHINKDIWGERLLKSNDELLEDYMGQFKDAETGKCEYMDKQTFEFIELTHEEVDKIKKAFIERIEKKKIKYAYEIEVMRIDVEMERAIEQINAKKKDEILPGFKVIELKK